MIGKYILALALALSLSGCAAPAASPEEDAPEEETSSQESQPSGETENLFETMPKSFIFCSGAGAWSTDLTIAEDGTFTGLFLDADMGDGDPVKYPNGTRYVCEFSGKLTPPEKIDETAYSTYLELMELEHEDDGTEEFADGAKYVYSGPYGLEKARELRIYLPTAKVEALPQGVLRSARGPYDWEPTGEGTLGLYVIYNVEEELGFVEYPLTPEEE